MRKLKTPEEIIKIFPPTKTYWRRFEIYELIKAAQRDALECVKEDIEKQKDSRYR